MARAAGLGEGFSGHSGRVGMAQDLAASGAELARVDGRGPVEVPANAGEVHREASPGPGRGGAVARYYQTSGQE